MIQNKVETVDDLLSDFSFRFNPGILFNQYFSCDYDGFICSPWFSYSNKTFSRLIKKMFANENIVEKVSFVSDYNNEKLSYEKFFINENSQYIFIRNVRNTKTFNEKDLNGLDNRFIIFFKTKDKNKCIKFIESLIKNKSKSVSNQKMSIICNNGGFYTEEFSVQIEKIDIDLNYNDDFKPVYNEIIYKLNNESKGLVLLHSSPGQGKSYLLRDLAGKIIGKEIIYITPDIANELSNPNFLSFFVTKPNSIFIIEDAENILKSRKRTENQAVANLLNLSDGLLSDALKIQIICTFNTAIEDIDSALRRPGRLIAEYKFEKLIKHKAQRLINKLYPDDNILIEDDMSLSEIYNYKEKKFKFKSNQKSIGFNSHISK